MRTSQRLIVTGVCLLAMLLCTAGILGQDKPRPQPGPGGFSKGGGMGTQDRGIRPFPPDPTFNFLGSEMRFGGPTVKGAPYHATVTTEAVQTLANGTRINHKTVASVYRDSDGRTRRDQVFGTIGSFRAADEAAHLVFIDDPVAGVHYVLDGRTRTAEKMKIRSDHPPRNELPSSSQAKTESLGTKTIEGVEAEGTRSTLTISAGQIGNDQPIEIISERWYSPELQVVVFSKHTDPRMGEHVYRLTNISRAEPARSVFDVPTDYTVTERSFDRGPRSRGMRPPDQNFCRRQTSVCRCRRYYTLKNPDKLKFVEHFCRKFLRRLRS